MPYIMLPNAIIWLDRQCIKPAIGWNVYTLTFLEVKKSLASAKHYLAKPSSEKYGF